MQVVGVVDGAIGGPERFSSVAALFPHVAFESAGSTWPERIDPRLNILVVAVTASSPNDIALALSRLSIPRGDLKVVVALRDADVTTTRRLVRAGASDVLPAPVSEPALALCLERLLTGAGSGDAPARKTGEVVAFLKAGGGVGATSLAVQMAASISARSMSEVCVADLDLQFGAASIYLDLPEAVSIADCMSTGGDLAETPYATALASHRSGARLLAAPREIMALEALEPRHIDNLLHGLRRDFPLSLIDLPNAWNAWTNQVLQQADRIILVTHLSVPHVQLVKRQLRILASQRLEDRPLILVCNGLAPEHSASIPMKAAERAIGRPFDVVIPEDRKTMMSAINQGVELSAVRRGTKLEKAIGELADRVAIVAAPAGRGRR